MTAWRNRIVGHGEEAPDQLLANPRNWRIHPKNQQAVLAGALNEVGWVQNVIVNRRTGHVVDGHLRVELAISREEPFVPVVYVDLDEREEAIILATIDPIAALAGRDDSMFAQLVDGLEVGDSALAEMLAAGAGPKEGLTDPDAVPETPVEPTTKSGDLWLLGEHRVLCGDSTKAGDVGRLWGATRAAMVWTDPPYGVAIGDKNKYLNSIARSNRVEENLTNDTLDEPGLLSMLTAALGGATKVCTAGAAWYVAAPPGPLHLRFGEVLRDLGIYRQTLIWVKNNATFAPMGVSYHWGHEPIFYGWMPNGPHRWLGDRKQTTVWTIDRPAASPEHPTMKPVELVTRAAEHSTSAGDHVFDPFLGSGTTLIACEQLGRRCYGIEIEPKYVDVIVARWEQFTGGKAVLDGGR